MCGDRRRRCWAETWDSGDAGGGRRRCWDRFCISDDAVEGLPSSAVQILGVLPMLRVRSVSYASNSWPSADAGHSKRRCWAKFWTAADAENAHSGVGLPACGSLAPLRKVYVVWFRQRTGRLALLRGLYGLFRFWRVGAVRFHSLFQSHTESNRTAPTHQNAKSRFR